MKTLARTPALAQFLRQTLSASLLCGLAFAQEGERGDVPSPLTPAQFLAAAEQKLDPAQGAVRIERIEGPIVLSATQKTLWIASALRGEEKLVIALDAQGQVHDLGQAQFNEQVAVRMQRGKWSAALYQRALAAPTEPTLAALWLDIDGVEDARLEHAQLIELLETSGRADEATVDRATEAFAARVAELIAPFTRAVAEELAGQGFEVLDRSTHAPLVFLRATPERLLQLSNDARVLEIDSAEGEFAPRLANAYKEVRADKLYSSFPSANADYTKVAVVESGKPCDTAILDIVAYRTAGSTSSHTTGVAGCIGSKSSVHPGVAKGAKIYGANGASFTTNSTYTSGFAGSVAAIDWAISQGCQVMNLSYGAAAPTSTVTGFDKYLDYVARYNAKTLAIACGNSGAYAGDPGAGYNQLAVGSFDDQDDYNWTGEPMASFSSWQNPSTGVETPQLAAPGVGITMPNCSGGSTYVSSGTSFSSPIVAGAAAVIIDRQPSLGSWPEAVRAILMASAWHNIEGASTLSSKDGAGGLDMLAAYRCANRGWGAGYKYGTLTSSSFDASGLYTAHTVYLTAGTQVRACLSFDSQVKKNTLLGALTWFDSTLASDLDLRVYGPNGGLVTSSSSSVNPFEVVTFTAPNTGNYTIKIRKWSFGTGSEYFGTAFSYATDKGL